MKNVVPLSGGQSEGKATSRTRMKTGDNARAQDRKSCGPGLMTPQNVAAHCQVSVWTVRGWVDAGKLAVVRLPGRLVRVRPDVLAAFLEQCR
jgi:excisionase family DNA binding protein